MTLKAIIFDVDGTLAETEEIHRPAFNLAFQDAGLDWLWDEALYGRLLQVAGGKERIRHFIDSGKRLRTAPEDIDRLIAALHRRKTSLYTEMLASGGVALRPGVPELIEGARCDGVRLAIATTASRANVDALLRATLGENGLAVFEVIAAGECAPHKKPAPDIYLHALARLDLSPRQCLAIEDSENGLRAASRAGLPTLVTPSFYSRGEDFSGAARVISTLALLAWQARKDGSAGEPSPSDLIAAAKALHASAVEPWALGVERVACG